MRKRKGFTLLELITVVIIIGILAMIAVPQFFKIAERGRAAEAQSLLGSLRQAEIRYGAEHGLTTVTLADLDVNMTDTKYFTLDVAAAGTDNPFTVANNPNGVNVAYAVRNTVDNPGYGAYTLQIDVNGTIACTAAGPSDGCAAIGY